MTTVHKFAQRLESWQPEHKGAIDCLAVPSGVGEPNRIVPLAQRTARIIVFGIRAGGSSLPKWATQVLIDLVRRWAIVEIAVVGDSPAPGAFARMGCDVHEYVRLARQDVSRILSDSVLGLSWYPPEVLAKSSVFAAYCAHGVPALVLGAPGREAPSSDGLDAGRHYLVGGASEHWDIKALQRVSDNAREWYAGHTVKQHARVIAAYIRELR